jgi:hypothetical protein
LKNKSVIHEKPVEYLEAKVSSKNDKDERHPGTTPYKTLRGRLAANTKAILVVSDKKGCLACSQRLETFGGRGGQYDEHA